MSRLIGYNSGAWKATRNIEPDSIQTVLLASGGALELSCFRGRLGRLIPYLQSGWGDKLLEVGYTSLHLAPSTQGESFKEVLDQAMSVQEYFDSILVHPDWIHPDCESKLVSLGEKLCIENMDHRLESWTRPESFSGLFQRFPDAGLTLDLAHLHFMDSSGELMEEWLNQWSDRLRHLHVSIIDYGGKHYPPGYKDLAWINQWLDNIPPVPLIWEQVPLWAL